MLSFKSLGFVSVLVGCGLLGACGTTQVPVLANKTLASGHVDTLADRAAKLGKGLRFSNHGKSIPEGATRPEVGAKYAYDRSLSANSRKSPMDIEIWVYGKDGENLNQGHEQYLRGLYQDIYGWKPADWKTKLEGVADADAILRTKSDLFWESLAQQLAERIFAEGITPALYRFGPHCLKPNAECKDAGILAAQRVVIKTHIDGRRDPMNPVTRSIYYEVTRGDLEHPELMLALHIFSLSVAGPHQEQVDYRPLLRDEDGRLAKTKELQVWAHLPRGKKVRTQNFDYPDYNLVFVPLRHLVFQGEVQDAKDPRTGIEYQDKESLIQRTREVLAQLRTPEGGQKIAAELQPYLTRRYYYMFEEGGQGVADYRNYILGNTAGVARGLNPDFGRIEVLYDGVLAPSQ